MVFFLNLSHIIITSILCVLHFPMIEVVFSIGVTKKKAGFMNQNQGGMSTAQMQAILGGQNVHVGSHISGDGKTATQTATAWQPQSGATTVFQSSTPYTGSTVHQSVPFPEAAGGSGGGQPMVSQQHLQQQQQAMYVQGPVAQQQRIQGAGGGMNEAQLAAILAGQNVNIGSQTDSNGRVINQTTTAWTTEKGTTSKFDSATQEVTVKQNDDVADDEKSGEGSEEEEEETSSQASCMNNKCVIM